MPNWEASNIQQGTPAMQPREVIEVENPLQFSFELKATDNTITKEVHSQAGRQNEFNDQCEHVETTTNWYARGEEATIRYAIQSS